MSIQSNSVYSEKLPIAVSQADLEELADPFEVGFNRTVFRVVGLLLPGGSICIDALCDRWKIEKIRSRIEELDIAARDPKAHPDVFIQKEICSSLERYTDRSRTIKAVTVMTAITSTLFINHALRNVMDANGNYDFSRINYTSFYAAGILALIAIGGFSYAVVRRYTEGLQLQADNMALASRLSYAKRKQI
jgi:hypothetical protein